MALELWYGSRWRSYSGKQWVCWIVDPADVKIAQVILLWYTAWKVHRPAWNSKIVESASKNRQFGRKRRFGLGIFWGPAEPISNEPARSRSIDPLSFRLSESSWAVEAKAEDSVPREFKWIRLRNEKYQFHSKRDTRHATTNIVK